jgi:hypothetical protein
MRIFVLSRVTPKSLSALPGMDGLLPSVPSAGTKRNGKDALPDTSLSGSNFLSVPESVLLKWLSAHFRKVLPGQAYRVTNFDADLRDGFVFYSLLVSHWPSLNSFNQALTRQAKSESKLRANAKVVIEMMALLRLPYTILEDELAFPQARELLVFCLYLYQALPQLMPRSTVEFTGRLGERLTKMVDITNPTGRPISYYVQLEGSKEFEVAKDALRIEPKGMERVMICCTPSISKPVEGRLLLASKRDGAAQAATMVFALRASVQSKTPLATWLTETRLFEYTTVELEIANPFPGDCEFAVTLSQACAQKPAPETEVKKPAKKGVTEVSEEPSSASVGSLDGKLVLPDAFGCDKSVLRLRVKEKTRLVIHFLPFQQGQFTCTVHLEDKMFGEIVHLVEGKAKPPAPVQLPKFLCEFGKNPVVKEVVIPVTNSQFETAKRVFLEKHPGSKNKKQAELLKAVGDALHGANLRPVKFTVHSSSQYVNVPQNITVGSPNPKPSVKEPPAAPIPQTSKSPNPKPLVDSKTLAATAAAPAPNNVLLTSFNPKQPGTYPCRLTLTSPADVRIFDLEFCASAPGLSASLAFTCPARGSIVQELPLSNSSDKPLTVKANFTSGTAFSGPREITVAPGGVAQYLLTFRPPWIGEYTSGKGVSGT